MTAALTETAPKQPDISYAPDYAKYQLRTQSRLQNETLTKSLPPGFPKQLQSDLVWEGKDLEKHYDWTYHLTSSDLSEIDKAVQYFKSLNQPLGYLDQTTFPLPNLHATLRAISRELHFGHGFKVVRGVPVSKYTREENLIIYAGISSHIGIRGRQDSSYQGSPADVVLTHIKDLSSTSQNSNIGSPAYTADKQVFHTDSGDIVSLFALSAAASGGASRLASTWRVYNELAATRPDLVHTLASEWIAENFNKTTEKLFERRPLMFHQPKTADAPDRVLLQYARRYFTGFGALPRTSKIPPITEANAEALDTLHFLGEKYNVGLDFRAGDIQYVNNLAVFHARDGFTDTSEQK